jgi:hypothetical protein
MKKLLLASVVIISMAFGKEAIAQRYLQADFISSVTVTKDVVYAQNYSVLTGSPVLTDLKMDVYSPDGDPPSLLRPMVIYLHTGSFLPRYINGQATGQKDDSTAVEMCMQFAKRGYVAVSMDYRLGWNPAAVGSAGQDIRTGTLLNAVYRSIQDAKACVRYFKKNTAINGNFYKVDTMNIVVGGQGSGGYVAFAYATLDKPAEIALPKFLSNTTNAQYGFVAGQPYVNQAVLGDFEGAGGNASYNSTSTINLGYTSDIKMIFNMGGALGDSTWMEAGEAPMAAMHVTTDPFAPYTYGQVIVPTTGDFVVNVSGSYDAIRRANNLGNNATLNAATFTDAYTVRADMVNNGVKNLFPLVMDPAVQAGPWEWWDSVYVKSIPAGPGTGGNTGAQIHANGMATNPDMSKTKALSYIDTAQGYFNPRIVTVLGLNSGVKNIFAEKESVKLYPNPSCGRVSIAIPALNGKSYDIEMYDVMGRLVKSEKNIRNDLHTMNTDDLNNGIYMVKISSEGSSRTEKLIVY